MEYGDSWCPLGISRTWSGSLPWFPIALTLLWTDCPAAELAHRARWALWLSVDQAFQEVVKSKPSHLGSIMLAFLELWLGTGTSVGIVVCDKAIAFCPFARDGREGGGFCCYANQIISISYMPSSTTITVEEGVQTLTQMQPRLFILLIESDGACYHVEQQCGRAIGSIHGHVPGLWSL